MRLYNLTLRPPTAIKQAGNYCFTWNQAGALEATGKVATVISTDVFGSIRSLTAFRLTGDIK
ncbi:hypothetical protein BDP27DRAFT_1195990, partial [Rhodocollybia butyracea]